MKLRSGACRSEAFASDLDPSGILNLDSSIGENVHTVEDTMGGLKEIASSPLGSQEPRGLQAAPFSPDSWFPARVSAPRIVQEGHERRVCLPLLENISRSFCASA